MPPIIGDDGEFTAEVPVEVSRQAMKRAAADRVLYRRRARGTGYDPETIAPVMGRILLVPVLVVGAGLTVFVVIGTAVAVVLQMF